MRFNGMMTYAKTLGVTAALVALGVVSAFPQTPEVLDRIVAAINHSQIVTASDVRTERMVQNALGFPEKDDAAILEELIGWRLLGEQVEQFEVTNEELEEALKKVPNPLAITIAEVRAGVKERVRRNKYIERRHGQFIHVTDEEKQQYYRDVVVPTAEKAGLKPPSPDDPEIVALIQSKLFTEKRDKEVMSALSALRARSDVEIFQ
jgi:hypothetical protein